MKGWFLKITDFAEELLDDLKIVKLARKWNWQKNDWKSFGAHIDFHVEEVNDKITVFSTRPDTLFGDPLRLSPEHKLVDKIQVIIQK